MSYARLAGFLYLVIAVFGAFSIGYIPSIIVAVGDAAATAANLQANLTLFKFGVFADVVVLLAEVALTAMLFVMFQRVSKSLALIAMLSRISMVLVMAINILIHIVPVVIISGSGFLSVFETAQIEATVLLMFEAHALGVFIWQLFFSIHLFALGYLVVRSELFPKILGWLMFIGASGYFIQGLAKITFVENQVIVIVYIGLLIVVTIGELAFALWLLVKGMSAEKWATMQV